MKITDIKCYVLSHEGQAPAFHWRQGLRVPDFSGHTMYSAVLRVDTDEGITGHAGGPGFRMADIVVGYYKPEYIGSNPAWGVKQQKESPPEFGFLLEAEIDSLLQAYTPELRTLATLAIYTGMRRGELFRLEWRNVDFSAGGKRHDHGFGHKK